MIVRHFKRGDFIPPEIVDRPEGFNLRQLLHTLDPRWAWVVECDGIGIVGIVTVFAAHGVVFPFFMFGSSKAPRSWLLKAIREISTECLEKGFRVMMVYLDRQKKSERKLASIAGAFTSTIEPKEYVYIASPLAPFATATERIHAVNE